ncbi:MAG: shikimate dehydrogenase [Clostridia bacterium]|nr:shikimate dehydrogenase [Clostridia bacterium]
MKYCLIGRKLSHSWSKEVHFALGTDYDLVEVEPDFLAEFLKNCPYTGFNVTIPYKKTLTELLDGLDDSAKTLGAVNTVVKTNGLFIGYNTDLFGMSYMLDSAGIELKNKTVMILGSGGTSNVARYLSAVRGAKDVLTVSRSGNINYENCYDFQNTEVIINTTPVGMFPDVHEKPLEISRFLNLESVADCIYNPVKTMLLEDAEELKLKCVNGLTMLVAQAVRSEELWLGKKLPHGSIQRALELVSVWHNEK